MTRLLLWADEIQVGDILTAHGERIAAIDQDGDVWVDTEYTVGGRVIRNRRRYIVGERVQVERVGVSDPHGKRDALAKTD